MSKAISKGNVKCFQANEFSRGVETSFAVTKLEVRPLSLNNNSSLDVIRLTLVIEIPTIQSGQC